MIVRFTIVATLLLAFCTTNASAQGYPDKIRGYKVYDTQIAIRSPELSGDAKPQTVYLSVFDPEVESIGLSGVEISFRATAVGVDQGGRVDRITFKDFRVNGIATEVADYNESVAITRGQTITLVSPLRSTIGLGGIATAGYRELIDPKKKWKVTGTMFVFGRFKKYGFSFKRVIPIKLDLTIDNPIQ